MKQRGLPLWDLTASVIIAATALAFALTLSSQVDSPADSPYVSLLFVLAILLPGYLLSIALFPRRYDLSDRGRLAVVIGADILLALILSIVLGLSSWGINLSSMAASASIISLVLSAIAYLSRSSLSRWIRFVPFISGPRRGPASRKLGTGISGMSRRMVAAIVVLAATVMLVAFAYTAINATINNAGSYAAINAAEPEDDGGARFTEFYVLGAKDEASPASVVPGTAVSTIAGIVNHESRAINYTLIAALNGNILFQKELKLDHNQSWEGPADYTLKDPGSRQRVDFLLYKEGDFSMPYSQDHLWINVYDKSSGSESALKDSLDAAKNSSAKMKNSSKVVILGIDEDDDKSNDKKRKSGSSKSSQKTQNPLPPLQPVLKPQVDDKIEQFTLQEMEQDLLENSGSAEMDLSDSEKTPSGDAVEQSSFSADEGLKDISIIDSDTKDSNAKDNDAKDSSAEENYVDDMSAEESDNLAMGKMVAAAAAVPLETDASELERAETDSLSKGDFAPVSEKDESSMPGGFETGYPTQSNREPDNPDEKPSKAEAFEVEIKKEETDKVEIDKEETDKEENEKGDTGKVKLPKLELPKVEPPKVEPPKIRPPKVEPPTVKPPKVELAKLELPKVEPPKLETQKIVHPKLEITKADTSKADTPREEIHKSETAKAETAKAETAKAETAKAETAKAETRNKETVGVKKFEGETPKLEGVKKANPDTGDPKKDIKRMDDSEADKSTIDNSVSSSESGSSPAENADEKETAKSDSKAQENDQENPSANSVDADKNNKDEGKEKGDTPASKGEGSASEKKKAAEVSEMDSEIDSWVGSRSFSKSGEGQSFKSKNINYVKNGDSGGSAVLGRQSKTPVRVG